MLDREIGLPGPQPEPAADVPTAGEARVECKARSTKRDGGIDVLAEVAKRVGGPAEDVRVVASDPKSAPGKIDALAGGLPRIIGPAVDMRDARGTSAAKARAGP